MREYPICCQHTSTHNVIMKITLAFLILPIVPAFHLGAHPAKEHYNRYMLDHERAKIVNTNIFKNEDTAYWNSRMQIELQAQLSKAPIFKQAKNIIFFLGDGTSISTLTAARILKGQSTGNFEKEVMAYEKFPYSTLIKTYSLDKQVTDSAASSTAYLTGVKGYQKTIGVDSNVPFKNCSQMRNPEYHSHSILKNFQDAGRSTGVVTVTRVTDASPAGNYAHTAARGWESDNDINNDLYDSEVCDDIAEQLVLGDTGSKIKVIMGGGRGKFLPKDFVDSEGHHGDRDDEKNLIKMWWTNTNALGKARYIWHRDELLNLDTSRIDYLMGLFDNSNMSWEIDENESNPSLAEMTKAAIDILSKDPNGYYLFVEGGNIDKAHHKNEARAAMLEALAFEEAIDLADSMTSAENTLIIVTADHSHSLVINGYADRGKDILGMGDDSDIDSLPSTTLLYANGPGYSEKNHSGQRADPTKGYHERHYKYDSAVPRYSAHHAGEDVILYARGPHAHLFTGIHENAYIPHALRFAPTHPHCFSSISLVLVQLPFCAGPQKVCCARDSVSRIV